MKSKTLLTISIIFNIVFAGLLILTKIQAPPEQQIENDEPVNFDDEFFNEVKSQSLTAQSLLIQADTTKVKNDSSGMNMLDFQKYTMKIRRTSKECMPIKDKRKFKIELGELIIKFKKDQPVNIKGLNISRESVDSLLAQIFIYDKALCNICKALDQLGRPTNGDERKYVLELMGKQQAIVESYTSFKTVVRKCRNEDEVKMAIEGNKPKTEYLKEENV